MHVNLHSPWTQDALSLKKRMETGRVSATHVLVEKRYGIRERLVACHMNLQSHWTQNAFYLRNTGNLRGLVQRAFLFKNTRVRGSGSRVAFKCSGKMQARRILHEKTQRSLRGRREWHINLQSKWRPCAFCTRKHNDFGLVGVTY